MRTGIAQPRSRIRSSHAIACAGANVNWVVIHMSVPVAAAYSSLRASVASRSAVDAEG